MKSVLNKYLGSSLLINDGRMKMSGAMEMIGVKQMRVYDELRELDIEDNEKSFR